MGVVIGHPRLLFVVSFAVLALCAWLASTRFERLHVRIAEVASDFAVVQGATLTLLGLIIGFTFSMAVTRYDQRKNLEEEEANAIGTEYLRAELLPTADAAKVRSLLTSYAEQRVLFYTSRDDAEVPRINAATARLQRELWDAVKIAAAGQPTPTVALAVAGMNDVLNSQGYTQAAWSNRIPYAAWLLMYTIAVCSTLLVGIGGKLRRAPAAMTLALPFVVSVAFFLVADIDSPRHGFITVKPQNLLSLVEGLRPQ